MTELLAEEVQKFIVENTDADLVKLALQKNPFPQLDWPKILNQIAARKKATLKLPTWFSHPNIIYPTKISVEQTSSEITAKYKASLVNASSLIDLTGGFGVDTYYFTKNINLVTHCEINPELSAIVAHNFDVLNVENCLFEIGDSTKILRDNAKQFEWIYVDPSRRNDSKGKVFLLSDCAPDVPELLNLYFEHSNKIMIKTAPLLDISAGISELTNVTNIHIVAVENDVKELLWILEKNVSSEVKITSLNFQKNNAAFFESIFGKDTVPTFSLPQKYLYEPNASIMKSGAFNEVSAKLHVSKLHVNSHLYTSDELIENFPGRVFLIEHNLAYNKGNMKTFLERKKANVTTRNFSEKVVDIRKKWKMSEGGNVYSFFTTDLNDNKIALLCTKL